MEVTGEAFYVFAIIVKIFGCKKKNYSGWYLLTFLAAIYLLSSLSKQRDEEHAEAIRKTFNKQDFLKNFHDATFEFKSAYFVNLNSHCTVLTLSYSSEGSPALAVFRHY